MYVVWLIFLLVVFGSVLGGIRRKFVICRLCNFDNVDMISFLIVEKFIIVILLGLCLVFILVVMIKCFILLLDIENVVIWLLVNFLIVVLILLG